MDTPSKEYILLFRGINEILKDLESMEQRLKQLQLDAEAIYINKTTPVLSKLPARTEKTSVKRTHSA